jgi:hypothetical protein
VAGPHETATSVSPFAVAATFAGTVGGVTSGGVAQTRAEGGERFPAASKARTA